MRGRKRALGKINIPKATRRLEMGWLHQHADGQSHKQVRFRSGGGTKNLNVLTIITVKDILTAAVDTFFPDEISNLDPCLPWRPKLETLKGYIKLQ
jgi:hypothetical protein